MVCMLDILFHLLRVGSSLASSIFLSIWEIMYFFLRLLSKKIDKLVVSIHLIYEKFQNRESQDHNQIVDSPINPSGSIYH